ncbi:hypothetical protein OSB04_000012 [Centaurea solstitialis]|uniref:Uncharacterized protein n=1 Tax=Centaurea solstitialis TaxID=347529 RepID=A0AA38U0Y2_9ASTR|nr:hypothetical protein OSB04_000012 [Centaurea solstitialis]
METYTSMKITNIVLENKKIKVSTQLTERERVKKKKIRRNRKLRPASPCPPTSNPSLSSEVPDSYLKLSIALFYSIQSLDVIPDEEDAINTNLLEHLVKESLFWAPFYSDISPLVAKCDDPDVAEDKDVAEVVRLLDQACREAGFFYVKGHGVPDSLIKEVRDMTHEFFDLPYEEKLKIKLSDATGYRGYQRVGENITKGIPDRHEAIDCYKELNKGMYGDLGDPLVGSNKWPTNPPKFKKLMENYLILCTELSRKIMRGIALALGGSIDEFEGKIAGDPFWVFRIIGLLTLVNQDDDKTALQVRNVSGEWISAVPIPGTFVCNIGDMLKILTNGLYESTLHRVINNSPKYRVCVAYFYEPNFNAAISPLDMCIKKSGENKKFESAVYGEHLVSKVLTNFTY